jgi:hypothetical protein
MQKPKFQDIFHPFQLCALLLTEALKLMGVQSLMRSKENEGDRLVSGEMNRTIHALILDSSQILAVSFRFFANTCSFISIVKLMGTIYRTTE